MNIDIYTNASWTKLKHKKGDNMLKTLGKQIKEFKAASIATPLFMLLEVLMETLVPFLMASIIDDGVNVPGR